MPSFGKTTMLVHAEVVYINRIQPVICEKSATKFLLKLIKTWPQNVFYTFLLPHISMDVRTALSCSNGDCCGEKLVVD